MSSAKKISSALVSVYHKKGIAPLIRALQAANVTLYATGGTQNFIEELNVPVIAVEDITEYPSILGGRVKTLHPKIFGGILSRRENVDDIAEVAAYDIPGIDLVIVDLYPFEEAVQKNKNSDEIIEKIDIGGISLLRAAAKNFSDVVIISSADDYGWLIDILNKHQADTTLEQRKTLAAKAYAISSHYDSAIFNWMGNTEKYFAVNEMNGIPLRYGENPHQSGFFFGNLYEAFEQLNGKELSYNNLLDIDAAVNYINEFEAPAFAIIKHNNACGLASRNNLPEAWKAALAGDPVSAFGGVIITNEKINSQLAGEISKIFFEVLMATGYDDDALKILCEKKNRIVLKQKKFNCQAKQFRSALNGVLVQDRDSKTETAPDLKIVTQVAPTKEEIDDLLFAAIISKHNKSNTIVLAKNKQLLGSGVGMTSRVDALRHAIQKAKEFGHDLKGAVMASDAFFPFPDCVEIARGEGISAVIQPGGSLRDQDSINFCNENKMAMVMTGLRHFKH